MTREERAVMGACGTEGAAGVTGAGVAVGLLAGSPPATTPPVAPLAGAAAVAIMVKLKKNVLRAFARKPQSSFVGLRD